MRIPALNRLHLPGSSGNFPPILHQYTSAMRPDDEARAIHWITFYAYCALCAPTRRLAAHAAIRLWGEPNPTCSYARS
jgi:hypothetical protein